MVCQGSQSEHKKGKVSAAVVPWCKSISARAGVVRCGRCVAPYSSISLGAGTHTHPPPHILACFGQVLVPVLVYYKLKLLCLITYEELVEE